MVAAGAVFKRPICPDTTIHHLGLTRSAKVQRQERYEFEWMAPLLCLHSPLEKRNANRVIFELSNLLYRLPRQPYKARRRANAKQTSRSQLRRHLASKRVLVVLGVPSMTSNVGISMSINTIRNSLARYFTLIRNNNATSHPSNYCPDLLGRPSCGLRPISQTGCFDCRQQTNLFGCLDA